MIEENTFDPNESKRSNSKEDREATPPSNETPHEPTQPADTGKSSDDTGMDGLEDEYLEPEQAAEVRAMDSMMDQYLAQMGGDRISEGSQLTVPVVAVRSDHVLVDLGEKFEGIIDLKEFPKTGDHPAVRVGDHIDIVVKGYDPESGLISLSHQEARRRKALNEVRESLEQRTPVKGKVIRTVKGGLILDIGTTAFLPASQIDLHRVEDFEQWVGREVEGFVIEFTPAKRRIIVSRRQMLEEQRERQRTKVMDQLSTGELVEGTVKRLVDFGAFVDLGGGIDGLVPRSEISWNRNSRPGDYLKEGETIQVRILEIDKEAGKITLSRRQAMDNPWTTAAQRYPVGSTVEGVVVSLTDYGAFVRVEEGLDGMIHVSDMSWDSSIRNPKEALAQGQQVSAAVLALDPQAQRMSLGLKQLTEDPWKGLESKYPKGARVKGPVTGLTKYGAFVEIEPGIEGMIHVSDFSWEKRIAQPRDVVNKGDEVEACILNVDLEKRRIALGIKQLSSSPFELFMVNHKVGDTVEGEVVRLAEFGAFVRLAEGVEGFMHVSQVASERVEDPSKHLSLGDRVHAKITRIDPEGGKISLSRRQLLREEEKRNISSYVKKKSDKNLLSMGELLEDIVLEDDLPPQAPQPSEPAKPTAPPLAETTHPELAEDLPEDTTSDDQPPPADPTTEAQPPSTGSDSPGPAVDEQSGDVKRTNDSS